MEELGIGRPSTYASILQVLKDRKYVRLDKRRLIPEDRGRIVVAFLESFFAKYVEYDFTAGLEEQLDLISNSEVAWRDVLRDFWRDFIGAIDETKDLKISKVIDALDELLAPHLFPPREDGSDPRLCPTCGKGRLSLKLCKFGAFIGCSNYPECRYTRPLSSQADGTVDIGTKKLGEDPQSGLDVTVRSAASAPICSSARRATMAKSRNAPACRREWRRKRSISTARSRCCHCRAKSAAIPRTASRSVAGIGRFGPYVQHGKTYANLDSPEEVFSVGLNRAVTLIAEKLRQGPSRPPLRRRSRPCARRSSDQGRRGGGEEGPLRPLCQPRRRQCHAAGRQDAGNRHA